MIAPGQSWWLRLAPVAGRPVTALTACGPVAGRLDKILLRPDGTAVLTIGGRTCWLPAIRDIVQGAA